MLLGAITGYGPVDFLIVYVIVGVIGLAIWQLVKVLSPPLTFAVFRRNIVSYFTNPIGICSSPRLRQSGLTSPSGTRIASSPLTCAIFRSSTPSSLRSSLFRAGDHDVDLAEERRSGTEELLLTLPGTDLQIVIGKFLAALAIYTVGLVFLSLQYFVLASLGSPDGGLVISTFVGYWLSA